MEIKTLEEMFGKAVGEINSFLDNKLITKEDVQKARIASSETAISDTPAFRHGEEKSLLS